MANEFKRLSTDDYTKIVKRAFESKFMDTRLANCVMPFLDESDPVQERDDHEFFRELNASIWIIRSSLDRPNADYSEHRIGRVSLNSMCWWQLIYTGP
jgi:hypothetical protein